MTPKSGKIELSTWIEIDLKAIAQNYREIVRLSKKAGPKNQLILAVVKADAYGHGMTEVAKLLNKLGVDLFGVSDVKEGIALRDIGIKKPILLFESTLPSHAKQILDYELTPTVCTLDFAKTLNKLAKNKRRTADIHVKVDTGMGRLGVWYKEAREFIYQLGQLKNLSIKGVYTHFPSADTDRQFTKRQIHQLYDTIKQLDERVLIVPFIHASNSMGLAGYQTNILNLARPGLMIYGLYPTSALKRKIKLKPAFSVKTRVIFVKKITKGRSISYGRTFVANKSMTVATLPIGYNDGYLRSFSNKSYVLVKGQRCPIVGRDTMDQIIVDVSKVKGVKLGTVVTVLGEEKGSKITADQLAVFAKTINYEVVCNLGNRIPRIYKK